MTQINIDNGNEYFFQIFRSFASFFALDPPPLFLFVSNVKKIDKIDGPDADKSEWIKLNFLINLDIPASKYSRKFSIFKDGFPEEWMKWVMTFL
jgi:hypothetical protein